MAVPKIVQTAEQPPGACFISGENRGPFLDTGRNMRRVGRVYLSMRHLESVLREAGWLPISEVERREEELRELAEHEQEFGRLQEVESEHQDMLSTLKDLVSELLPEPEPEQVEVIKRRAPTDEEVADFLERNPSHRLLGNRSVEPGSLQEYERLYGGRGPRVRPQHEPVQEQVSTDDAGAGDAGPPSTVEVHGQAVDLDAILDLNVKDVVARAEGNDEDFLEALLNRELWRAEQAGKDPRSTIFSDLGYDLDEFRQGGAEDENLTEGDLEEMTLEELLSTADEEGIDLDAEETDLEDRDDVLETLREELFPSDEGDED